MTDVNVAKSEAFLNEIGKLEKITLISVHSDSAPHNSNRYEIYTGIFGDVSFIDKQSPAYFLCRLLDMLIAFIGFGLLLSFVIVAFTFGLSSGGGMFPFLLGCFIYLVYRRLRKKPAA